MDSTAKRMLALALLRNGEFKEAIREAEVAADLDDMATVDQLIISIAEARLGDMNAARSHLTQALAAWPENLRQPGDFYATAHKEILWFETADELIQLRNEAQSLIDAG